jgi:hypothetical protein
VLGVLALWVLHNHLSNNTENFNCEVVFVATKKVGAQGTGGAATLRKQQVAQHCLAGTMHTHTQNNHNRFYQFYNFRETLAAILSLFFAKSGRLVNDAANSSPVLSFPYSDTYYCGKVFRSFFL